MPPLPVDRSCALFCFSHLFRLSRFFASLEFLYLLTLTFPYCFLSLNKVALIVAVFLCTGPVPRYMYV